METLQTQKAAPLPTQEPEGDDDVMILHDDQAHVHQKELEAKKALSQMGQEQESEKVNPQANAEPVDQLSNMTGILTLSNDSE
jgi:hypothetical protein